MYSFAKFAPAPLVRQLLRDKREAELGVRSCEVRTVVVFCRGGLSRMKLSPSPAPPPPRR